MRESTPVRSALRRTLLLAQNATDRYAAIIKYLFGADKRHRTRSKLIACHLLKIFNLSPRFIQFLAERLILLFLPGSNGGFEFCRGDHAVLPERFLAIVQR